MKFLVKLHEILEFHELHFTKFQEALVNDFMKLHFTKVVIDEVREAGEDFVK